MPITLVNRAAHSAAECGKAVADLPTPVDEQANGERSDKRTESAEAHGPTDASGANGSGVQQGRQRDQSGARDTQKKASQSQARNDECDGLTCVTHCAERDSAANQSGR